MIARSQINFAFAVAIAEFEQLAGTIDAQPLDRVARPAAAVAVLGKPALGREHAFAAVGGDVALEVGLAAEQPEAVLDLPLDLQRRRGAGLGVGSRGAPGREQERDQANSADGAHGRWPPGSDE